MVSEILFSKELNREIHKELFYDNPSLFIDIWKSKKKVRILFSKKSMEALLINALWDKVTDKKLLCEKLNIPLDNCKKRLKRKFFSKRVLNAVKIYGLFLAYKKSLCYNSLDIQISGRIIEEIICEDLFNAGYTPIQVSKITGVHIRKSYRIHKRLKSNG